MDIFETYEYVVTPKNNKKRIVKKVLFILLYTVFVLGWLVLGLSSPLPALLALVPLTTWMLVFATWRYVNVEYEYAVAGSVVTFSKIYGGKSRKLLGELDLKKIEELLPLCNPDTERYLDEFDPEASDFFLSSHDSETAYAAVYVDEDGTKCVVYLEILDPLMKTIKTYNYAAVRNMLKKQENHT